MPTLQNIFRSIRSTRLLGAGPLLLLCIISGCAQPIKIVYKSKPLSVNEKKQTNSPVAFFVEPFTDERAASDRISTGNPRVIGRITAVVADYMGAELEISDPPQEVVDRAFTQALKNSGYKVLNTEEKGNADFVVKGAVRGFRLDIGSRDDIDIRIYLKIIETETGRVIWEGIAVERNSRFAGVTGNTKDTIAAYAAESIEKAIHGALSETSALIENTRAAYAVSLIVPTLKRGNDKAPTAPPQGTGRLVVTAEAPNAKVYINGVYFGMTPFKTDMEPGVYELNVRRKGFKEVKERVSVRLGEMTEVAVTLDKE
ncbi:MAG: PEGA domain-containing protein [Deltaproteobacteria bacterium]|nr:PEGA domain-containing protein [Deltaproteobacteria bacterium]